jgi:hypothetical protein
MPQRIITHIAAAKVEAGPKRYLLRLLCHGLTNLRHAPATYPVRAGATSSASANGFGTACAATPAARALGTNGSGTHTDAPRARHNCIKSSSRTVVAVEGIAMNGHRATNSHL